MITGVRRIKDLIHNRAKGDSAKSQMLLRHYAMERLLERLSVSDYSDNFIIKGGMLVPSLIGVDALTESGRDIDYALLDDALDATTAVRKSTVSLNRSDEVINLLEESKIMEGHWGRYQTANPFAVSISWLEALASLRETVNAIKDAKTNE